MKLNYLLLLLLLSSCIKISQKEESNNHKLSINLKIKKNKTIINNSNTKILFTNSQKDTLYATLNKDLVILPNFNHCIDTVFKLTVLHDKYIISFDSLTKNMIIPDQEIEWELGVDDYPFEKKLQQCITNENTKSIQYLIFNLYEFGDGIILINEFK